ncbi:MAG TPA: NAD(P)-dependent oxidoreductase [Rhodocyclaceae bacterium]|nr:NAD(P)-dependent oxidoreductase [Rhodocyclaceae bacterium]
MEQLLGDLAPLLAAYPLPELRGQRLFITGATGFMGYWLLLAIHCLNRNSAGIQVHALSRDPEAFLARRPECQEMEWLTWVQGDARDYSFPPARFDAILHGAADTSPEAARHAEELKADIVVGTRHVLDHATACGAKRILLLSSGTVYGEQPETLTRLEESAPCSAEPSSKLDGYLAGKRIMESLALSQAHKPEPVIARCFAFVGYGLPSHLAVGQFIRDAKENAEIAVNGDGRPVRSFLYAADLAVWLLALLAKGRSGQAYNVGSPNGMPLAEVAATVRDTLAPGKPVVIKGATSNHARQRYVPDVRKAEQELGLGVWTQFPEAIRLTARASD